MARREVQIDSETGLPVPEKIVLDPATATPFEQVLIKMIQTHRSKSADYTGGDWWSQNFYDSAYMTGQTAGQSIEILLGTKAARLRVLLGKGRTPANEAVVDTLEDRAVYAAMAVALWAEGGYDPSIELGVVPVVGTLGEAVDQVAVDRITKR